MAHDPLTLTLPDESWLEDVSLAHSDVQIQVLTVSPDDPHVGVVELVGEDHATALDAIERHEATRAVRTLHSGTGRTALSLEAARPLHSIPIGRDRGSSTPPRVHIVDGTTTVTVPTQNRMGVLERHLDDNGVDYNVDGDVSPSVHPRLLTDRQRELIRTAIEMGYYDTPRECTMTEIAERLGIAKSTCSETLHRAEESIVKSYVDEQRQIDPATA